MSNQTTVAALRQQQAAPAPVANAPTIIPGFFDNQSFELMQRVSKMFSASDLVPQQYRGPEKVANCTIALDMAQRIGANPLMVMQNLYIVHGTPSWSSKFLIATINSCGRYSSLRYEWQGKPGEDDYGCRAWAVEKATGERLDGIWVTWKMVNAEGWASKNGSKWKTMPDQMFVYRAAAFWQRAYAPELGMGLQTVEDVQDTFEASKGADGMYAVDLGNLRGQRAGETIDVGTGEVIPPADAADPDDAALKEVEKKGAKANTQKKPPETQERPAFGFATVEKSLNDAADIDLLDAAADLINEIASEEERNELTDLYRRRREALAG